MQRRRTGRSVMGEQGEGGRLPHLEMYLRGPKIAWSGLWRVVAFPALGLCWACVQVFARSG